MTKTTAVGDEAYRKGMREAMAAERQARLNKVADLIYEILVYKNGTVITPAVARERANNAAQAIADMVI